MRNRETPINETIGLLICALGILGFMICGVIAHYDPDCPLRWRIALPILSGILMIEGIGFAAKDYPSIF